MPHATWQPPSHTAWAYSIRGSYKKGIFQLLGNAFDEGASGLSTGLIYPPGVYSDTGELIEITGEALKRGGIVYATHMRSEGDTLLEAVDEAIGEVADVSGIW